MVGSNAWLFFFKWHIWIRFWSWCSLSGWSLNIVLHVNRGSCVSSFSPSPGPLAWTVLKWNEMNRHYFLRQMYDHTFNTLARSIKMITRPKSIRINITKLLISRDCSDIRKTRFDPHSIADFRIFANRHNITLLDAPELNRSNFSPTLKFYSRWIHENQAQNFFQTKQKPKAKTC